MSEAPMQDASFIDLNEPGGWSEGFLVQFSSPCSFVLSADFPQGNSVSNKLIASFRTQTYRSLMTNRGLCEILQQDSQLNFTEKIQELASGEKWTEKQLVQVYGGYLAVELSRINVCNTDIYDSVLCRFYSSLNMLSPGIVNQVWAGLWDAEQRFLSYPRTNTFELLSLHFQAFTAKDCPLCLFSSFPSISKLSRLDTPRKKILYDWNVCGAAAKAYMTYSIRTVNMREAIHSLAIVLRCYVKQRITYPDWLIVELPQIAMFFPDFPECVFDKAAILNYLLVIYVPEVSAEEIMEGKLLDKKMLVLLCKKFPVAAAKILKLTISSHRFRSYVQDIHPGFATFSLSSLEKLLTKLPDQKEYDLCRFLRHSPLLRPLEDRPMVKKALKVLRRYEAIWIVFKSLQLPKSLIIEIVSQI